MGIGRTAAIDGVERVKVKEWDSSFKKLQNVSQIPQG